MHPSSSTSQLYVDEQPLADSPPMDATLPDGSTHGSSDVPADTTYDCYQSTIQSQIITMRVDEVQTDRHASWASTSPSEVNPPPVRHRGKPYIILYCSQPDVSPSDPKPKKKTGSRFISRKIALRANPIAGHCRQFIFRVAAAFGCHRITYSSLYV